MLSPYLDLLRRPGTFRFSFAAFVARLPMAMLGLGVLCGIGFTMSLFIGSLAFAQSPSHYTEGVAGVLAASVVTAIVGMLWLHLVLPKTAAR